MHYPTITIGCPISNRAYLIDRYLNGILNLDYPKEKIKIYFLLNNSNDGTQYSLTNFKNQHIKSYLDISIEKYKLPFKKDARVAGYRDEIYRRLVELRNHMVERIETDYFFSVDSDIILNSNCLIELVKAQKHIIAAVINNDKILRPFQKYPEIRTNLLNNNGMGITHYLDFPLNEIVEVDYTGAVYLISKEVCSKVRYDFSPYGEDIPFCYNAKMLGYKIYAHTGLWQTHVMCEYQQYCIDNKCQKPCMKIDKNVVYQFKYIDNNVYPSLHKCPRLVSGEAPLLTNI